MRRNFLDYVDIVGKTPEQFNGTKKYVSTGAVDFNVIDEEQVEYVDYENKPSRANLETENGDVLFAKMQNTKKILKIDCEKQNYIFSTGFFAVRPRKNMITNNCLYHLLCSEYFLKQKDKNCSGATQKAITNIGLSKINIKIPDLEYQDNITMQLDKIDSIMHSRKQQLSKLDGLVKARFVEMFGDPIQNTMGWTVCELSECIQFLTSGSRGWAQYFTDDGEYFITIKNVKNCRITLDDVQHIVPPNNAEAKRTKVQEGDLLISITADLGRTGIVTKEIAEHGGYINQHLTCIRLDQSVVRPLYIAYYLESEAGKCQFQSKNQSAVKAGLNFNAINSLRFMLPPIELQDRFIEFIKQTDKSKSEIQKSLEKLEMLKKALMQKYFG